jgi:3,4-dihydroxy-9,10-secoandrosta-1,3,5(10)-triene-9,17-dione 4,5-dioxygenase
MGVKALGYVVIQTANVAGWDQFLTEVVGTMAAGEVAGANHYRIDDRPFRFRVEAGSGERLLAAAYEVGDANEFHDLATRITAAGRPVEQGAPEEARARGVEDFFKTSDPAGNGLEFFVGDQRDGVAFVSPAGVSGFVTGAMGMGHAVFAAPNFDECHAFYRDVIGLHDTDLPKFFLMGGPDDPGVRFAFMHADNGRHHSLAMGEMPGPPSGCIHLMLEMKTLADVGKCHDRMRMAKIPESASIGRHLNDQVTSFYMQTPGGFDLEIGFDGLVIDPASWTTTAHDRISEWGHVWAWQKAMEEAQG